MFLGSGLEPTREIISKQWSQCFTVTRHSIVFVADSHRGCRKFGGRHSELRDPTDKERHLVKPRDQQSNKTWLHQTLLLFRFHLQTQVGDAFISPQPRWNLCLGKTVKVEISWRNREHPASNEQQFMGIVVTFAVFFLFCFGQSVLNKYRWNSSRVKEKKKMLQDKKKQTTF